MKKLWVLLLLFFFIDVKAATVINPIEFELSDEFYLDINKYYKDDVTYFEITNKLSSDLTKEQLKEILRKEPGEYDEYLSIYSKLRIKVNPLEDVSSLKDNYYLGLEEKWNYEEAEFNIEKSSKGIKLKLDDAIDLYSGGIIYKSPSDDEWTTIIPDNVDLEGKTLEEQLATLLNLDLNNDKDIVIDNYQKLYNIYGIAGETNNIKRFDFYNSNDFSLINRDTDKLEYLTTRYVVLKYKENTEATFNEIDVVNEKDNKIVYFVVILLGISVIVTVMKAKKVLIFK